MDSKLQEMIDIIDSMPDRLQPTKMDCNVLNNLREQIDGHLVDDCFCTRTARRSFLTDIINWINK